MKIEGDKETESVHKK